MHRGHLAIIKQARALAGKEGKIAVLSFSNHPSEIFKPDQPTLLVCSLPHKIHLIEKMGIHYSSYCPLTAIWHNIVQPHLLKECANSSPSLI